MPADLAKLLGKPLKEATVALIPNGNDYLSQKERDLKVNDFTDYLERHGLTVTIVDLRDYDPAALKSKLAEYDLVWAMGGNTFVLRYEMHRSRFDTIIRGLLESGVVYAGDSAGALVAGQSIAGIESADEPELAAELITEGLSLVPAVVLPHVDNPTFTDVPPIFRETHKGKTIIELKDSQAVIFDAGEHWIVEAEVSELAHE